MHITFVSDAGDSSARVEMAPDTELSMVMTLVEVHLGIPATAQALSHNGKPMVTPGAGVTLASVGVEDEDLIVVSQLLPPQAQQAPPLSTAAAVPPPAAAAAAATEGGGAGGAAGGGSGPPKTLEHLPKDPEGMLKFFEENPQLLRQLTHFNEPLAEAIGTKDVANVRTTIMMQQMSNHKVRWDKDETIKKLESDPYDEESQKKIADMIQQEAIDRNLRQAMEETPEVFGRVCMLYIDTVVNKQHVKAFVDSGAQSTIMSMSCVRRCNLEHLIDKRYSGEARGVGSCPIIGRIHSSDICIDGNYLTCSFTVLEKSDVEMLFGLDMLKRHLCCIDLATNQLRIGTGLSTPFLSEKDLPESVRKGDAGEAPENDGDAEMKESGSSSGDSGRSGGGGSGSSGSGSSGGGGAAAGGGAAGGGGGAAGGTGSAGAVEASIQQLVGMGFNRAQASGALSSTGGNVEEAASLLLASMN